MAGDEAVQITLEDDATPLVRILGATLRRSARNPALESKLKGMRGVVALKSSVDPQAVTIRFDKGRVALERGVAADSGVVIEADLTKMNDPGAEKPKLKGVARHPKLALAANKVLDPKPGPWQDEARLFWAFAHNHPRMPSSETPSVRTVRTSFSSSHAPSEAESGAAASTLIRRASMRSSGR